MWGRWAAGCSGSHDLQVRHHQVDGSIPRIDREPGPGGEELLGEADAAHRSLPARECEETVIEPAAAAESVSCSIKSKPGREDQIDLIDGSERLPADGLGDPESSLDQVPGPRSNPGRSKCPVDPVNPGQADPQAPSQRSDREFGQVDLSLDGRRRSGSGPRAGPEGRKDHDRSGGTERCRLSNALADQGGGPGGLSLGDRAHEFPQTPARAGLGERPPPVFIGIRWHLVRIARQSWWGSHGSHSCPASIGALLTGSTASRSRPFIG